MDLVMAGWKTVLIFRRGAVVQVLDGEDGALALLSGIQWMPSYEKTRRRVRFHSSDEL
jgi:hypothetical protein